MTSSLIFLLIIFAGPYGLGLILWGVAEAMDNAPGYLRDVRIHWLERRAERRRADGSRGPLARWALQALVRRSQRKAGGTYGQIALWHVWLASPDDQVWVLLDEYHRSHAVAMATDPAHSEDMRSVVGAFCTARGLAPQEPSQRALFFVLTGQRAQHRAEDPDGSLLAEAYRAAREEQRAAVRQALAGADNLDLVRVIAGAGRDAVATVTPEEASYLAGQFAARRDWAGLLQFALGLPLADAVTAASWTGDGWQPDDTAGQALLRQLATGDAQQITLATADGDLTAARNTTAELLRHPLGLLTLTDFNTVASLLLTQPSKPLELLAACLDYRFGSEIAFGEQVPVTPGSPDDIAVSPGLARQPHAQA